MTYKCKICGAILKPEDGSNFCTCEYCGCVQSLSNFGNKKIENLFKRGSELMRSCQFYEASKKFEEILDIVNDNSEIYWNLLMCHFGVTYEKDPISSQMIPTIHRTQNYSIFLDDDYNNAIEYSNDEQRTYYEKTAKIIDDIQRKYSEIIKREEPYDVFICYKQQDDKHKDTEDYKIAYDLYNDLTAMGYNVFFSHVSLEDKIGEDYEPYIYAALKSSRIMISIGTTNKFYEAVWVKNEWLRFLLMMKENENKILIPLCNKSLDLPKEFSRLQAIQMNNNIVWKQDLIRQINKIAKNFSNEEKINDDYNFYYDEGIDINNDNNEEQDDDPKILTTIVRIALVFAIIAAIAVIIIVTSANKDSGYKTSYVDNTTTTIYEQVETENRIVKTEIRIRNSSSQDSNIVGHVYMGDIINVLESKVIGEYTWYRIGTNQWIADPGYWTEALETYQSENAVNLNNYAYLGANFTYGKYEQDNVASNGSEDICWRVIAVESDRVLVISEFALDCRTFNDSFTNWEKSSVRKWLNDDFINSSFSLKEIEKIIEVKNTTELNNEGYTDDKVFLLSMTEIETYMPNSKDRICYATDYAISNGANQYKGSKATWWWLRTMDYENQTILNIRTSGDLRYVDAYPTSTGYCIRPAMWLSLK